MFEKVWDVAARRASRACASPTCSTRPSTAPSRASIIQGEDIAQSDPNTQHVSRRSSAMECVVVQDLFLNETAAFAHVFLPGTSFLEKDGTFTNAERRINRVRKVMAPKQGMPDWEIVCRCRTRHGLSDALQIRGRDHGRDRAPRRRPSPACPSTKLDELGSVQWPCNDEAPEGTPIMHIGEFVRGKGRFMLTEFVPTDERTNRSFPLILTTGRILVAVQCRRPDAAHRQRRLARRGRARDPSARRRRCAASRTATWCRSRAASARPRCARKISERMPPGVVYTTFHHPVTRRQRHHHGVLRLGHQLPRIQGDGGAGDALQPSVRMAEGVGGARGREQAHWRHRMTWPLCLVRHCR